MKMGNKGASNMESKKNFYKELRHRAEDLLARKGDDPLESFSDVKDLVHELTVYQLELEMQNDELQRTQSELKDSRNAYLQLFDFAPNGYVSLDRNAVVQKANLTAAELLGLPRQFLVGRPLITYISSQDHERFFSMLSRAFEEGSDEDFEITMLCRGRRSRLVKLTFQTLHFLEDEGQAKCLCALEDVTDLRENERNLELSLEMAEQASHAKSEFLANMSHEIRTPISGVMGMLQLIEGEVRGTALAKYADLGIDSCKRLVELVSDILDLSRIEAGKLEFKPELFRLATTMKSIEQVFKVSAEEKGLRMNCRMDPECPETIISDSGRLHQILNNLVGNSLKFTDSGTIEVDVWSLPSLDKNKVRLLFRVSDTGIGVPDEYQSNLFTPFTQVDGGYSRKFQGAGLGLSIVRQLVEMMEGNICINSKVGVGTDIYFTIQAGLSEAISEEGEKKYAGNVPTFKGKKALVAEDDMINSLAVRTYLEKSEFDVRVVENGRQALDALKAEPFDVVLMDVQMPIMDGMSAVQAIRKGEAGQDRADVPVVALTAYAMASEQRKFLKAGMDECMVKPVERAELLLVIKHILDEKAVLK